jgi:hypothetical protein
VSHRGGGGAVGRCRRVGSGGRILTQMLQVALSLQSRARAAMRRARERERSKEQARILKDIQLYKCALKETPAPQT